MKDRIKKMIEAKEKQLETLRSALIESESKEERAEIGDTISKLGDEIAELKAMLADVDAPAPAQNEANEEGRGLKVLDTFEQRGGQRPTKKKVNRFDTEEYREAFMNFACRGVPIPAEMRDADAITTTTDASAVIPTTILNEMIIKLESYGNLYSRVRKLNIQGGVKIPILSLKPTATWITADTGTSESYKQNIQANSYIEFSYYGLECKVAQTLLVNVVTLEMFQSLFAELAVEAIAKALDIAIVKGDGSGEPTGILNDARVPSANKITLSEADVLDWSAWKKKVFAKIPAAYRNGVWIMAQGTWDGYIDGMVDSNGQPIGRVNYNVIADSGESYRFGGKEVIIVENDVLKDWDSATGHATTGDPVMIFCNLNDYGFNTNMEMQVVKWTDHDTNEVKNKVILIADGKLIDPNGVIIVKKGV